MATTAREAMHKFVAELAESQKVHPATAEDYQKARDGFADRPNLNDLTLIGVERMSDAICLPRFTEGYVFVHPGPEHDTWAELNKAALQEQSDEADAAGS